MIQVAALSEPIGRIDGYSDADWQGCPLTHKSTSGSLVFCGGSLISSQSKTQEGLPALSSGEAELRAAGQTVTMMIYIRHLMEQFDIEVVGIPKLWLDSNAAIQHVQRLGPGRLKHLETRALFIQQLAERRFVEVSFVLGVSKPADILTKYLTQEIMNSHLDTIGLVHKDTDVTVKKR